MKDLAIQIIEAEIAYHRQRIEELERKKKILQEALTQPQIILKPQTLDQLPWKPYSHGNGSWIFSNLDNEIAKTLVELIKKYGGKIEIGNYVYRFSGENNRFISRYPKR